MSVLCIVFLRNVLFVCLFVRSVCLRDIHLIKSVFLFFDLAVPLH